MLQSLVADCISMAMHNFYTHPLKHMYNIVLQIHDAVFLEVPVSHVEQVYNEVVPQCMEEQVFFHSCDLNGVPRSSEEFRFHMDRDLYSRWGENITMSDCLNLTV